MPYEFEFTVFTPTYNRRHTLQRLYNSLTVAGDVSFEWLIVDDGSTDGTSELIRELSDRATFPIRYHYKRNGGKHTAHNTAVSLASGHLMVVLDSDDELLPNALSILSECWKSIDLEKTEEIAGILGHSVDGTGQLVGSPFPRDLIDGNHFDLVISRQMVGDKLPCYLTEVLKAYPFPEPTTRSYIPEGIVWQAISRRYLVRCINENLRIYHRDQSDTNAVMNSFRSASSNSYGKLLYNCSTLGFSNSHFLRYPLTFIKCGVNSSRFARHSNVSLLRVLRHYLHTPFARILVLGLAPFGVLFYLADRLNLLCSE